jgi:NAD(P)H-hydrate epimerase
MDLTPVLPGLVLNHPPPDTSAEPATGHPVPLPLDDPAIFELDLDGLAARWASTMAGGPITAETMIGTDRRAQAHGVPGSLLMEQAGTAVAATARALADRSGRWGHGPILVLCGPGNNGGDGMVAARLLAGRGAEVVVVLVSSRSRPGTPEAERNWDRLAGIPEVTRMHAATPRDMVVLERGIQRAAVLVEALLGTGVHGQLREPVRSAVELVQRARLGGVPIVAVDTPTALDLTSGEASDPVVRADITITFHRPKVGLQTRTGRQLAGRVLVAPIGVPVEADRG